MFNNATNGSLQIGNTDMDFVVFGKGDKNLLMIPGLGDGLKTVKGTAILMSKMYSCFANDYKVYLISRKNNLESGYTTKDMAADYMTAMEKLGIQKADVAGVSQGGMIAQYIAIDYPCLVNKLVLAVTLSRQNETVQSVVGSWIKMAENDDYRSIFIDTSEKLYSENRLKKIRPLYPLLSRIGKPKNLNRFITQANSCITHNAYDELPKITCPTLIIGSKNDKIVGPNTSEEISEKIPNNKLTIYNDLGHGLYEEAKDFNSSVLEFLNLQNS